MELCSIASGSSGNCIYAGTESCHLLIDAGISGKRIEEGLNEIGLKTSEIQGILVTHEHSDHIKGLGVIARRYGIPMYGTQKTFDWIRDHDAVGDVDEELFNPITPEALFSLGDMDIFPVRTSHDAADPVAYVLRQGKKSIGVITDLGMYDEHIISCLMGLDVLFLEANHDVHMLKTGIYPEYLKQRILSDKGHLSNEIAGRLLGDILHDGLKKVILGHLSLENNRPGIACDTVRLEVTMGDNPYRGSDFPVDAAKRGEVSEFISI